jgi:hypothetical protein
MSSIETDPRGRHGRFGVALTAAVLVVVAVASGVFRSDPSAEAAPQQLVVDAGSVEALGNGRLPLEALEPVAGVQLSRDAAEAMEAMIADARRDGAVLAITDGYRTYEEQVDLRARKPRLAATPGTSMHGWGLAVDFDMRTTDFAWLREHAHRYGWVHPAWAQPGGSKPEPWHWEFVGVPRGEAPIRGPAFDPEPGELVATVRFEPATPPHGRWFEVRAELEGFDPHAAHYPGTAAPGTDGNFAIAGLHRRPDTPLYGIERLAEGDVIRVRTPAGEEHVYLVLSLAVLDDDDGWAVGSDPLGTGSAGMMTLTTSAGDGRLLVVWAALS